MNAITKFPSPFGEPVTGELLFAGFQMTDTLQLDLYGERDEDGCTVTSVAVPGSKIDICELISGRQLEKMAEWLDFKDLMSDQHKRIAAKAKHEAVRPNF